MNRTITYRGSARGVGLLAHMLSEEGVEARYTPPMEQRGASDVVEVVVIHLTMKAVDKATDEGIDVAVKRAVAKFRKLAGGNASVDGD